MSQALGTVYLIGAGPGDPGLITVRGRQLLEHADVILHDRLVSRDLLADARPGTEVINVGKVPGDGGQIQEDIHATLIDRAQRGLTVIRLKGGDPLVFGRGWEEWRACRDAAVPCIVVPGVTSAIAAPAAVGIPVTHRGTSRTFAVTTAQTSDGTDALSLDYGALAKIDTVAILMGKSRVAEVTRAFITAGRDPATPAACIEQGTTPWQRSVLATLATIADAVDRKGLRAPVVTVVGEVARCADEYKEYLNSIWTQCAPRTRPGATLSGPTSGHHEPLAGKRIVITRSSSSLRGLRRRLSAVGASTIEAPMIRIEYPQRPDVLDAAIHNLECYDWIAFTSVHGVRGFFERLKVLGRDARAMASCKVAAIGPITASALRKRSVRADLVPHPYSAATLVEEMLKLIAGGTPRVLCPRGDIARPELPQGLRRGGVTVDEAVAYHTVTLTPPESVLRVIAAGVDAILLCSPSAARRFAEVCPDLGDAAVACIGPSTASAAQRAGITVDVVADEYTDEGLIAALRRHFATAGGSG